MITNYKDDINFMVTIKNCIIKVIEPRISWLSGFGYEMEMDYATIYIELLINSPLDPRKPRFGTYTEI